MRPFIIDFFFFRKGEIMNAFDEYTNKFDMNDNKLSYKYYHSYRVMNNMIVLAKNLNLSYCDIKLAKCIGLLHDIGRFEQYKRYHSFNDKLLDHGDYGSKIIKEKNILTKFEIKEKDYEIVYKTIRNHNKYEIEPNLTKRELLFAKMIRDADKIDILYALNNSEIKSIIYEDDSDIRDEIKQQFLNHTLVKRDNKITTNENIVVIFSFVYDLNFNLSLDLIKYKQYYEKIYERLIDKDKFKIYIDYVKQYIDERID